IESVVSRSHLSFIVGGTNCCIESLLFHFNPPNPSPKHSHDKQFTSLLNDLSEENLSKLTSVQLHESLSKIDKPIGIRRHSNEEQLEKFHEEYNQTCTQAEQSYNYTRGIFQAIGFKEFHDYLLLSNIERKSEHGEKVFANGRYVETNLRILRSSFGCLRILVGLSIFDNNSCNWTEVNFDKFSSDKSFSNDVNCLSCECSGDGFGGLR
ncbi:unnamed protein product, partial [Rotaria sordida]